MPVVLAVLVTLSPCHLITLSPWAARADEEDPDAIPQVGRPTGLPFSEASGNFVIETDVDRDTVQVEKPIQFVLRVTARDVVRKPPRRLPLTELPEFQQSFHVEDVPDPTSDRAASQAGLVGLGAVSGWPLLGGLVPQTQWEFRYLLRPKSTEVTEVPGVPFPFYNPRLSPRQRFQVPYSDPIPIRVKPREVVEMAIQAPEEAFQLATGPGLLATVEPWSLPGWPVLVMLGVLPPAGCLAWYLVWRRLYPDAARLTRLRRSRAAQLALELLRKAPTAPHLRAQAAGRAVTRYLRLRLDLPIEEPTPGETLEHLARLGISETVSAEVSRFYQTCDRARFAPAPPGEAAELPSRAAELILAVEAETERSNHRDTEAQRRQQQINQCCCLLCVSVSLWFNLSSSQELAAEAASAFAEGVRLRQDRAQARPHFRQAAERFEALCSRGVSNPLLYRNLGHSWLLAGDLPRAILAYRQGLRLLPGDAELQQALEQAREQVIYPDGTRLGRPAGDNRPPWLPRLPAHWLFLSAVVLYVAGWSCLARWLMVGGRWLVPASLALVGVLGLTVVLVEEGRQERERSQPLVIVAEDGVLLRKGDSLHFPPRFETPLNRGVEARLLYQRRDWLQIELGGGEVGWVPARLVLILNSRTANPP